MMGAFGGISCVGEVFRRIEERQTYFFLALQWVRNVKCH
jgi:hypothetical protein